FENKYANELNEKDDTFSPKFTSFYVNLGVRVEVNDSFKAYQEDDLKEQGTIRDRIGGNEIEIKRNDIGVVRVTNLDTGEKIVKVRTFWFAWYAFYP
ncbi:MAG: hypothetical protein ACLFMM_04290, partial [Methanohalobium sp.]